MARVLALVGGPAAARRPAVICAAQNTPPGAAAPVKRSQLLKGSALLVGGAAIEVTLHPSAAASAADEAVAAAAAGAAAAVPAAQASRVAIRTLSDCRLAVGPYPTFSYNAAGGGGEGAVGAAPGGAVRVAFPADALRIPAVDAATTRVLGVPIPPPLRIAIRPQRLEGTVDPATGVCRLDFLAEFLFTAGPLYSAPPLVVSAQLTTEGASGELHSAAGRRLAPDGRATLVGVARVPKTGDALLDAFLTLPTDALAVLSAELEFLA